MVMPDSAVAVWSAGSWDTIRFMRARDTTISARTGGWPKSILVPPPRGITVYPCSEAIFTVAERDARLSGATTAEGTTPSTAWAASVSLLAGA